MGISFITAKIALIYNNRSHAVSLKRIFILDSAIVHIGNFMNIFVPISNECDIVAFDYLLKVLM